MYEGWIMTVGACHSGGQQELGVWIRVVDDFVQHSFETGMARMVVHGI